MQKLLENDSTIILEFIYVKKGDENWRNIWKIRFAKIAKKGHFSIFCWETSPDSDNRVWEQKAHQCRHVHGDTMFTSNYFGKHVCYKVHEIMVMCCTISACQEQMSRSIPATPLYSCHRVFKYRFIFRSNFPVMRLPWECHDQLQETNWLLYGTVPELPFFHERN